MSWLPKLSFLAKSLFRKRKLDAQLSEEIQAHVDMATEANVAAGMSPEEARYAALREFGNVASVQERARDEHGWVWLEQFGQNVRLATRSLVKARSYTSIVVLTLALGIGANTAIFSMVEALMLRRLPVQEPDRLVVVRPQVSYGMFNRMREQAQSLSGIVAIGHTRERRLTREGADEATPVRVQEVSGNFFRLLGVAMQEGRALDLDDDRANAPQSVVVLSHRGWQHLMGAEAGATGRVIKINNVPVTIVGVAVEGFAGVDSGEGDSIDLWCPLWLKNQLDSGFDAQRLTTKADGSFWINAVGRLAPGASMQTAQAELELIFRRELAAVVPVSLAERQRKDFLERPFWFEGGATGYSRLRHSLKQPLTILWSVAVLVLVVACVNVANLIQARGFSRSREMAVRLAIGASRRRVVMEIMTENLLLGLVGGGVGVLFAFWGTTHLQNLLEADRLAAKINVPVLFFALAIALLSTLVCGLVPALWISRTNAALAPKGGFTPNSQHLNQLLTITQIAISFVLLSGAGLLIRTLQILHAEKLGFSRADRVQFAVDLSPTYDGAKRAEIYRRVVAAIEVLPGVESATIVQGGLLSRVSIGDYFLPETLSPTDDKPVALFRLGGHRYFETRGIALLQGRDFTEQDGQAGSSGVAVISEMVARKYFGNHDPIGGRIRRGDESFEIVGVAADVRDNNVRAQSEMTVYLPFLKQPGHWGYDTDFCVKLAISPALFRPALLKAVQSVAADAQVINYATLAELFDVRLSREQAIAEISGLFSIVALMLSAIGLYGVLSFRVIQRTREIGIRVALGAQMRDVLNLIMGRGLVIVLIGCALGLMGAIFSGGVVASMLYGVTTLDFTAYLSTLLIMVPVALLACWFPARRAARVDPATTLRAE